MPKLTKRPNLTNAEGLRLSRLELAALRRSNIFVVNAVTLVKLSGGLMLLSGVESGGGSRSYGHYCGYLTPLPSGFHRTAPIPTFDRNGKHRAVFASELVRYEVFRYNSDNLHLRITHHFVNAERRTIRTKVLFFERNGRLEGNTASFFSMRRAEDVTVPEHLLAGFRAALDGSRCLACKHSHFSGLSAGSPKNKSKKNKSKSSASVTEEVNQPAISIAQ